MSELQNTETEKTEPLISDTEPIEEESKKWMATEKDLNEYIESPVRDAVRNLMETGVQTLSSSANKKNLQEGKVNITINWDELSQENKNILKNKSYVSSIEEFGNFKKINAVELQIPVNQFTTEREIVEKFDEITKDFKKQNPSWIPEYTLDDLLKQHNMTRQDYENEKNYFEEIGYYFDKETQKFYEGDWHYKIKKDLKHLVPK